MCYNHLTCYTPHTSASTGIIYFYLIKVFQDLTICMTFTDHPGVIIDSHF